MKKVSILCTLLLAFCMSALAQTDKPASGQTGSMSDDKSSDMKHDKHDKMGKEKSMKGCIAQQDGKFMLMDKKHPNGIQLTSSQDLAPHVGHMVEVKGTMQGGSDSAMASESSKGESKGDMSNMHALNVTDMKMISEHCDMDKGMGQRQR